MNRYECITYADTFKVEAIDKDAELSYGATEIFASDLMTAVYKFINYLSY